MDTETYGEGEYGGGFVVGRYDIARESFKAD